MRRWSVRPGDKTLREEGGGRSSHTGPERPRSRERPLQALLKDTGPESGLGLDQDWSLIRTGP